MAVRMRVSCKSNFVSVEDAAERWRESIELRQAVMYQVGNVVVFSYSPLDYWAKCYLIRCYLLSTCFLFFSTDVVLPDHVDCGRWVENHERQLKLIWKEMASLYLGPSTSKAVVWALELQLTRLGGYRQYNTVFNAAHFIFKKEQHPTLVIERDFLYYIKNAETEIHRAALRRAFPSFPCWNFHGNFILFRCHCELSMLNSPRVLR